jgi:hypothetical protein
VVPTALVGSAVGTGEGLGYCAVAERDGLAKPVDKGVVGVPEQGATTMSAIRTQRREPNMADL